MAIPAFNRVRTTAQTNAITNNLRQIASAADQYFLDKGVTSVDVVNLLGTDATDYIKSLSIIAGETYPTVVNQGFASLTATGGAPGNIVFNQ